MWNLALTTSAPSSLPYYSLASNDWCPALIIRLLSVQLHIPLLMRSNPCSKRDSVHQCCRLTSIHHGRKTPPPPPPLPASVLQHCRYFCRPERLTPKLIKAIQSWGGWTLWYRCWEVSVLNEHRAERYATVWFWFCWLRWHSDVRRLGPCSRTWSSREGAHGDNVVSSSTQSLLHPYSAEHFLEVFDRIRWPQNLNGVLLSSESSCALRENWSEIVTNFCTHE